MKAFGAVLLVVFTLVAVAVGSWVVRYYTAELKGMVRAEEQITDAPSRIARYEYFFDLCAAVQNNEAMLAAQKRRLKTAMESGASDRELTQIRSAIAGIEAQRARNINQYNSESTKEYTSARFKASGLPYRLDINNPSTTCSQ